eukprot:m.311296 g.311296  ORF g.311296 m.311296 type:complete len:225 (-) comp20220_c0_seq6:238-912(-)
MSQAADASRQREPDAQKLAESLGNSLDLSIAEKEASLHENIVTVMQLCGARFKEMTEGHLDAPSSKALIDMYKLVLQARRAAGEARVLTAAGKDAQMVDAVARDREEHATTMLSQKTIIEQRADALTKALVDRDAEARAFVYKVYSRSQPQIDGDYFHSGNSLIFMATISGVAILFPYCIRVLGRPDTDLRCLLEQTSLCIRIRAHPTRIRLFADHPIERGKIR